MSHGIKYYPGKSRSNTPFPSDRLQPGSILEGEGLLGPLSHLPGKEGALFITLKMQVLSSVPSMCLKSQMIDLKAEGYWEELMDTFRPEIVVKDW